MTATPTRAQLTPEEKARQRLVLRLAELGIPTADTDRQRHVCAVWTRGQARKRSEMTEDQADSLTRRLRQPDAADALAHALTLPVPAAPAQDEPVAAVAELPAAVAPTACRAPSDDAPPGLGPVPHTSPAVEAATTRLAEAAQAGIDLDAAAEPVPTTPSADPPAEPGEPMPPEAEPAPLGEDPGPGAEPIEQPEPEPPAGDVEDQAAAEPTAPVVTLEPPCRTPEEIEAAAEAAVERFRARAAAGIVPEPPNRLTIPRREPVSYAAPGRYCLARCYCGEVVDGRPVGGCPQYAEQHAAAERAYSQELTAARNKDLRR